MYIQRLFTCGLIAYAVFTASLFAQQNSFDLKKHTINKNQKILNIAFSFTALILISVGIYFLIDKEFELSSVSTNLPFELIDKASKKSLYFSIDVNIIYILSKVIKF